MSMTEQQTVQIEKIKASCIAMGDNKHLTRERSFTEFKNLLKAFTTEHNDVTDQTICQLESLLTQNFSAEGWEARHGAVIASGYLFEAYDRPEFRDNFLKNVALTVLLDEEFRVRIAVGTTLHILAVRNPEQTLETLNGPILNNIEETLERDEFRKDPGTGDVGLEHKNESEEDKAVVLEETKKQVLMHDSQGWKSLETSTKALQKLMTGLEQKYEDSLDERFMKLLQKICSHTNRFVREIGMFVCGTISTISSPNKLAQLEKNLWPNIASGLADNWSQVRYAASQAVRTLMLKVKGTDLQESYEEIFIPRMCLNRYYFAPGVRIYSQESWRLVVEDRGIELVAKYAQQIVDYYAIQSAADNHAVREAACHCIAELGGKVAKTHREPIVPFVEKLTTALLDCFKDESWPVRDAACVACGNFVLAFPEECRPVLPELLKLWTDHLSDNINSVRENSACALMNATKGYPEIISTTVKEFLDVNILKAKDQKSDSKQFGDLSNETKFGVAKVVHHHHGDVDDKHSNQQMFSCGSLAPKLKRGGGCMDHGFKRATEPWEASDGAVYLLREVSAADAELTVSHIGKLAELHRLDHFSHYPYLHENIDKSIVIIAKNLGKKPFKAHLEILLPGLFRDASSTNRNLAITASDCIRSLSNFLGNGIFRGRIENWDDSKLDLLDKIMTEQVTTFSEKAPF